MLNKEERCFTVTSPVTFLQLHRIKVLNSLDNIEYKSTINDERMHERDVRNTH